jgi:hypothetical protein
MEGTDRPLAGGVPPGTGGRPPRPGCMLAGAGTAPRATGMVGAPAPQEE